MIPIIIAFLLGGAVWFLRDKKPSDIQLTEDDAVTFVDPQDNTDSSTRGKPWYRRWEGKSLEDLATFWNDNRWIRVLSGLFGIWIVIWMILPEWWASRWWENGKYLIPLLFLIYLGSLLMPKPSVPLENRVGKTLVVLGSLTFVLFIFLKSDDGHKLFKDLGQKLEGWTWSHDSGAKTSGVETPTTPIPPTPPPFTIPLDNPVAVETDAFWRENVPSDKALLMITIAYLESGFRQFKKDGTLYRGSDPRDVGVMQISEYWWLEKAKELNYHIDTTQGNLDMALWIYRKKGPKKWKKYDEAVKLLGGALAGGDVVVIAHVGKPSHVIPTPGPFSIHSEGPIWIFTSDGRVIASYKDAKFDIGRTSSLAFQSRTTEAVTVAVSR